MHVSALLCSAMACGKKQLPVNVMIIKPHIIMYSKWLCISTGKIKKPGRIVITRIVHVIAGKECCVVLRNNIVLVI